MRENRSYGSEGGEPQLNAAFLPLSFWQVVFSLPNALKEHGRPERKGPFLLLFSPSLNKTLVSS